MIVRFSLGFAAAILAAPVAMAQGISPPAGGTGLAQNLDQDSVTVGIGAGYMPDYEGSDDYQWVPVPGAIGSVSGINFQVLGNRASADLIAGKPGPTWDFQLGPVGVLNFMRNSRDGIDDPRVRALGKRSIAVELGGYVGIGKTGVITSPYDKLSVSVSYRHDVAGVHDSHFWQPTINYFTPLSRKSAIALFGSAERVGSKYVQTYFSVPEDRAAASGLPVYTNGRGGWKSWTVGTVGTVSLTGDLLHGFKLVGGATYRKLINDVGDSPIVRVAGSRNQWLGVLGVAYTF